MQMYRAIFFCIFLDSVDASYKKGVLKIELKKTRNPNPERLRSKADERSTLP